MKKRKIIKDMLFTGSAAAAFGTGLLFHDIIARKKQEETDLIVRPDMINGEERVRLWRESNRWLNHRGSEKVFIRSFDGLQLAGEFFKGDGDCESTVLLVHGYRSNRRREYAVIAKFYLEAGFHVLMVDDRAHGESEGRYIGFGCLDREDCYRWVHYLEDRFGGRQNLFLHGISMGAATVLMTSSLNLPSSVRGIVADCGYTSPKEQFSHVLRTRGKSWASGFLLWATGLICRVAAGYGFSDCSSKECVRNTRIPVFVIHGTEDDFVPTYMGKEIYEACAAPKRLYLAAGAGHAESYYLHKEEYEQKVLEFFRDCLGEEEKYED